MVGFDCGGCLDGDCLGGGKMGWFCVYVVDVMFDFVDEMFCDYCGFCCFGWWCGID